MERLRQRAKKMWKKQVFFLKYVCTSLSKMASHVLERYILLQLTTSSLTDTWLLVATWPLTCFMNNGTLEGKSTHAVLFHEAIFYQPRKKSSLRKISGVFFCEWEIKIDSLSLLFLWFFLQLRPHKEIVWKAFTLCNWILLSVKRQTLESFSDKREYSEYFWVDKKKDIKGTTQQKFR